MWRFYEARRGETGLATKDEIGRANQADLACESRDFFGKTHFGNLQSVIKD